MFDWLLHTFGRRGAGSGAAEDGPPPPPTHLAAKAATVPSFRSAMSHLGAELDRARRYEYPLSLLVLTLHYQSAVEDGDGGNGDGGGDGTGFEAGSRTGDGGGREVDGPEAEHDGRLPHPMALLAAWVLKEVLRESDIVTYDPVADRFVLVLPESNGEAARGAILRLDRMTRERMMLRIRVGTAVFPEDGLTIAQLVERGEEGWRRGHSAARPDVTAGSDR